MEKLLGKQKVRTQSLVYINSDEGVTINVHFKRAGNIVECISSIKMNPGVLHTRISSDFIGDFPSWACPDIAFGKEQVYFHDRTYKGVYDIIMHQNGRFTILYGNWADSEISIVLQFTYIVDDSNTEYQLGDVDGNGVIDEVDLRLIQNSIQGHLLSNKQSLAADINQDSNVNSQDYALLKGQLGL